MSLETSEKTWSEDGVTMTVRGEIDIYSAPQMRHRLLSAIESGRVKIVADLQDVAYLDSTGLGVLIGVLRRVRDHGGDMVIVCDHPRLVKIFEITGLTRIFRLFPNEASAIVALTAQEALSVEESE